jgi:hypothetical protein
MKKIFLSLALLALAAVGMLSISSCGKEENEVDGNEVVEKEICNECHCQVENPLTELEWLKKEIERYDNADVALTVYSCKYKIGTDTIDKDGFVIECGFRDLYDCSKPCCCCCSRRSCSSCYRSSLYWRYQYGKEKCSNKKTYCS